jgi:hypothetical protein
MFLRFRVKAAISKFILSNRAHADVLNFLEAGPLDSFMPLIERAGLDGNQGAVTVITGTVTNIASSNGFRHLINNAPHVYMGLRRLWFYCEDVARENPALYETPFIRSEIIENPFEDLPLLND